MRRTTEEIVAEAKALLLENLSRSEILDQIEPWIQGLRAEEESAQDWDLSFDMGEDE
jgi:hypothetical protein